MAAPKSTSNISVGNWLPHKPFFGFVWDPLLGLESVSFRAESYSMLSVMLFLDH